MHSVARQMLFSTPFIFTPRPLMHSSIWQTNPCSPKVVGGSPYGPSYHQLVVICESIFSEPTLAHQKGLSTYLSNRSASGYATIYL